MVQSLPQHSQQRWIERNHWIIALLVYTLLSVVVTFPLVFHLTTMISGPSPDGDNLWYVWSLWATRHAILSGHDPNHTHDVFALLPSVQVFVDAHVNTVIGFLLQWVTSPLGAYNLLVLLSFVLSGLTMYLLAGEFVTDRFACFAAGFLYTFSTYHFARAAGHLGLLTLQWLPFCAWRLFAFYRRPSWRNALLAGIGIALVPLSEVYFLAYFLVPFGALFILGGLIADRHWFTNPYNLRLGALAITVAAIITVPALIDYVRVDPDVRATSQLVAKTSLEPLSADLATFVLPSPTNPLLGSYTKRIYARVKTPFQPIETSNFFGYPLLLLGLAALLFRHNRGRTTYFWLILGVGGLVLACGPALFVVGHRIITLPTYKMVFGWPLLSTFRAPNRLSILPLLALAVLSALTIAAMRACVRGLAINSTIIVLMGISLAQSILWGFPYPTTAVHMPELYREIGNDTGQGLLLDVPFVYSGAYQYYQTVHHKPLVFGYVPRVTSRMLDSVYNVPYLSQFEPVGDGMHLQLTENQGDILPKGGFKEVLRHNGIKYVVMHRTVEPESYAGMRSFLIRHLGVPFYDSGTEGLTAWQIPIGASVNVEPFYPTLGSGWLAGAGQRDGLPEREMEQDGQIVIIAQRPEEVTLSFLTTPIFKPLTIEIRAYGQVFKTVPLIAVGMTQAVNVAHIPLEAGTNTIELHAVEGCVRPSDISSSPDIRCFSIGVQQIQIAGP